jgi:glucose/arabinose dehydrogenase
MRAIKLLRGVAALGWSLIFTLPAWAVFPTLSLQTVETGLGSPVDLTHAGDSTGRLFVVERAGYIKIIGPGFASPHTFLDIHTQVITGSERGLLGLAFHPNYAGNGKFYVYFSRTTALSGMDHESVIAEFTMSGVDPNDANDAVQRNLLVFGQTEGNHNGGCLKFGPDDGYLYISSGDGGGGGDDDAGHTGHGTAEILGNAQDKTKLLGKILRIDVDTMDAGLEYGIPTGPDGNPFVGEGGGVREEIYAYGLRNPWRMSFDDGPDGPSSADRLFVGDVGQNSWEEVNIVIRGGNYGWRRREGANTFDTNVPPLAPGEVLIDPIAEYANTATDEAVIGGFVYRGCTLDALLGKYIFADLNGRVLGLEEDNGQWSFSPVTIIGGNPISGEIHAFGEDEAGNLYVVHDSGTIFRIEIEGQADVPAVSTPNLMALTLALLVAAAIITRRRRHPLPAGRHGI